MKVYYNHSNKYTSFEIPLHLKNHVLAIEWYHDFKLFDTGYYVVGKGNTRPKELNPIEAGSSEFQSIIRALFKCKEIKFWDFRDIEND